jgi:hypothetical protein
LNQAAARRSYAGWKTKNPRLAERHDLDDYVGYVQQQHEARPAPEAESQASGIAAANEDQAAKRRARLMADLLAEHYNQEWLPDSVAARLTMVELDRKNRRAVLHLEGGGRLLDYGDRLELKGDLTPAALAEMAEAAERHGWKSVKLSGSPAFRDALSVQLALREPPILGDHQPSPVAIKQLSEARAQRAAALVPAVDTAALSEMARHDPKAAAVAQIDAERSKWLAALAGRPTGITNAAAIAEPKLAELIAKRDAAVLAARESRELADRHRAAHSAFALIIGPDARRQRALGREAGRLKRVADDLAGGQRSAAKAIVRAAGTEAKANLSALKDWQWTPLVNGAQNRLAALDRVSDELDTPAVQAAAARGDLAAAIGAADGVQLARRAEAKAAAADPATQPGPRTLALRGLLSAEDQAAADPAALAAVRRATAAALAGHEQTITAAARGDIGGATAAGKDWQKQQAQAANRKKQQSQHDEELDAVTGYN